MADVSWTRRDDRDCILVSGVPEEVQVEVRPVQPADLGGARLPAAAPARGRLAAPARGPLAAPALPATAGRFHRRADEVCFVPRFAFVPGTAYAVVVDGEASGVLVCPRPAVQATTEVLAILPSAPEVPRNLLRCYVWFSAPMSEGYSAGCVRLLDHADHSLAGAFLAGVELWDSERRRLTVLLDPARIKRGLVAHLQAGYPLEEGSRVRLVVDSGFRDAAGAPLRRGAERGWRIVADERRRVRPERWTLVTQPPERGEALRVVFDRPLDHGLALRCLAVIGPDGQMVGGTVAVGENERSWTLTPDRPWSPGPHRLAVEPILEDPAGNSVSRVFDRDLSAGRDDPAPDPTVVIPFVV